MRFLFTGSLSDDDTCTTKFMITQLHEVLIDVIYISTTELFIEVFVVSV